MISLLEVVTKSAAFLETKGVEHARLNAELLVGHALGLKRMELYLQFERLLPERELEAIRPLIKRRSQREPLQHIVGSVEFAGIELKTDRRALIPRPETEFLVELLGGECDASPPACILDLGTGSGALALALAHRWSEARVTATDVSKDALALARENTVASKLEDRVTLVESDWFAGLNAGEGFGLIVSNPPYLTRAEVEESAVEVRGFEPSIALSTSEEGSADLLTIISEARRFLVPGGLLAMETGIAQHPRLLEAFATAGFENNRSRQDLAGRDRFVWGNAPAG